MTPEDQFVLAAKHESGIMFLVDNYARNNWTHLSMLGRRMPRLEANLMLSCFQNERPRGSYKLMDEHDILVHDILDS